MFMENAMMADIRRIVPVFLKAFFAALAVTAVEIGVLSLLLYKTDMSENSLHIAVIAGYGIACFLSGLYCGKKIRQRRFLWGMLAGLVYYVVLLGVSFAAGGAGFSLSFISSALVCLGSGMLGGMLS